MSFKPGLFLQKVMSPFKKSGSRSVSSTPDGSTIKKMDVVSNPDASEEDWLQAFHGLGYERPKLEGSKDNNASPLKNHSPLGTFDALALRAVPIIFVVGIGAYAAVTLQEHFVPKHEDTPWDHMVPLKERVGTSDPEVFRDKILANWEPIKGVKKGYTVLKFDVRSDGSFKNMQVESPNTTVSQQNRAVDAVLTAGPFFCRTERTDKFASVKVYFDNGKVTVETYYPRIYHGLESVDTTDVKYDVPKDIEELHVNANEVDVVDQK